MQHLGASVRVLEQKQADPAFAEWAAANNVRLTIGEHKPEDFFGADILVPSPGAALAQLEPMLPLANKPEVLAETELAWRFLQGEPVIGITGTSGKTTTTSLCGAMLQARGLTVFVGGNIGTPLSEYVLARLQNSTPKADVIVLELSSFQLQTCQSLRPKVAVLLNISENHLDYHANMKEYIEAKMRLFRCQTKEDFALFGPTLRGLPDNFTMAGQIKYLDFSINRFPQSPLFGPHNIHNAEAAFQAAKVFGVTEENAAKALATFKPLEHRLEKVAEHKGILYINDSKCTTVEALRVALNAFNRPIVLLAGGKFKGGDLESLRPILTEKVRAVCLYGAYRETFTKAWEGASPLEYHEKLDEALPIAQSHAKEGDVILLAPATASFDQYNDYLARGEHFKNLVLTLTGQNTEKGGPQ